MSKVIAVNGSPRMARGDTELILAAFLRGMADAGTEVETVQASRLGAKRCDCSTMRCWYKHPGRCYHDDAMSELLVRIAAADILILATPVYIPLPGDMQDVINRLCPLLEPFLETRAGRTRGRLRDGVRIRQIGLVSTGGWWEMENFDTVVRIVREFCEDASAEYVGAVLRPHAGTMKRAGVLTAEAEEVLRAARLAGRQLIENGAMDVATLEAVSRPLVSQEDLLRWYNTQV